MYFLFVSDVPHKLCAVCTLFIHPSDHYIRGSLRKKGPPRSILGAKDSFFAPHPPRSILARPRPPPSVSQSVRRRGGGRTGRGCAAAIAIVDGDAKSQRVCLLGGWTLNSVETGSTEWRVNLMEPAGVAEHFEIVSLSNIG